MSILKFKGEWALLFLFILLCICGYTIHIQSQQIVEVEGQRDRLSDYIREYTDMQYSNDTVSMTVVEFVESEEIMDNNCDDLGFRMKFNDWYFAYLYESGKYLEKTLCSSNGYIRRAPTRMSHNNR